MVSASVEDYLRIICQLQKGKHPVKTTQISNNLHVTPASVTQMLNKLQKKGYVSYTPYKGTTLTPSGRKLGKKMIHRFESLKILLHKFLGIKQKTVQTEAHKLEHVISPTVQKALDTILEPLKPTKKHRRIPQPHTHPLKHRLKHKSSIRPPSHPRKTVFPLTHLEVGETAIVVSIHGGISVTKRLNDLGVTPNAQLTLVNTGAFHGPLEINIRGTNLALGRRIAKRVMVKSIKVRQE